MAKFAEENGLLSKPQRALVGSFHCFEMPIITPLLKWLLDHGMVCTKVHQAFEWKPFACFDKFVQMCCEARRRCDLDPDYAPTAEMFKLLANSVRLFPNLLTIQVLFIITSSTDLTC